MRLIILIFVSFFFTAAYTQEMPILTENSVPGIEKITSRHFEQDGLWGYINGGADLYLEYGFEQVAAQVIMLEGSEIKADIYRMSSPETAFGIFSIMRFRCTASGLFYYHDCLTPYQYIAAKGSYYLSISNASGLPEDQEKILNNGKAILNNIDETLLQRPAIFESEILSTSLNGLKLVHGPLGLQNGFMRWDRLFTGFENYQAWILPVSMSEDKFTMAWIRFEDEGQLLQFIEKNALDVTGTSGLMGSESTYTAFRSHDGALLLFEGTLTNATIRQLADPFN